MRKHFTKAEIPVSEVRRYLEPGPIVLLSSAWNGRRNIMTLGWHTDGVRPLAGRLHHLQREP